MVEDSKQPPGENRKDDLSLVSVVPLYTTSHCSVTSIEVAHISPDRRPREGAREEEVCIQLLYASQ